VKSADYGFARLARISTPGLIALSTHH